VWLAFAHVALAAVLAGMLARSLGATTLGSVTAGFLYSASLPLWGSVWTPPMLYTAAWVPGLLLAVDNAVERPGARRATALGVVLAAMILAGWPHALVMAALAAAITGTRRCGVANAPASSCATLVLGAGAGVLTTPQLAVDPVVAEHACAGLDRRAGREARPDGDLPSTSANGLATGAGLASPCSPC
jgi:hypothetical protein